MCKENSNFHSSGTKQRIDQSIDILYAGGVNNPMDAMNHFSYSFPYYLFKIIPLQKNFHTTWMES